jgi:hypothetical protein
MGSYLEAMRRMVSNQAMNRLQAILLIGGFACIMLAAMTGFVFFPHAVDGPMTEYSESAD